MMDTPHYLATIKINPSTELLTDEYIRRSNKSLIVQIVYGKRYEQIAMELNKVMKECNFTVNIDPFVNFPVIKSNLIEQIRKQRIRAGVFLVVLCNGSKKEEDSGHLFSDDNEKYTFVNVWDQFLKMKELNRLPKIFLFQTHLPPSRQLFDGPAKQKRLYDTAAPGADMMLISRSTTCGKHKFIERFCQYISDYSQLADIFEIATFASEDLDDHPLIVSTLTAKFFFSKSAHRHYNYQILDNLEAIENYVMNQKQQLNKPIN